MNQLEDMRILLEVVERGSFSAAATRLGLSKQLLSRRVMALEDRLGARLLLRTTRRLTPTELGRDFAERARRILADVDEAELAVSGIDQVPRGLLRLCAPMSFGTLHLSSLLAGFLKLHSGMQIDLDLNDRRVDIVGEGYDAAIRIGQLADSTLIARKIVSLRLAMCASPDYLERNGTPRDPSQLKNHACLSYGHGPITTWTLTVDRKAKDFAVNTIYRANNGEVLRDAAIAGLGIALLPTFLVGPALHSGALIELLPRYVNHQGATFLIHPAHRQRSVAIAALGDYLLACCTPVAPWDTFAKTKPPRRLS